MSFNLNFIMQLKQFYYIVTKVSSRKSATTFGDLPDCLTLNDYKHAQWRLQDAPCEQII